MIYRLSTVTLIVEKYTLYNMLLHVMIFKVTIILSLIKDASYTQALYMHVLIRRITMNLSSVYLFFRVKRENNALPEFFKMFSIVQMMFIKEVNLIQ